MLLKQFGGPQSNTISWGYDLPLLVGHLEALADDEAQFREAQFRETQPPGSRTAKRLELVQEALQLLNQALDMGQESR